MSRDNTNSSGLLFSAVSDGFSGGCSIDVLGDLSCSGSIGTGAVAIDGGGRKVVPAAIEAPENWFEDAGSGHLTKGVAVVNLEEIFGQAVNTQIDYHVFLTPEGDCKGLYVTGKTPTSFVVRELGGGTSNIDFEYRIMAKRKGYEEIRWADRTKQLNPPRPKRVARKPPMPSAQELLKRSTPAAPRPVAQLDSLPKGTN